jgi:hypothetical protein
MPFEEALADLLRVKPPPKPQPKTKVKRSKSRKANKHG